MKNEETPKNYKKACQENITSLKLILVISRDGESQDRVLYLNNRHASFYVILINNTDHNQNIWKEQCSWGYGNLFFKLMVDGTSYIIKKKLIAWGENPLVYWTMGPNDYFVYNVTLIDKIWDGIPPSLDNKKAMLTAIYEIVEEDKHAKEFNIWTGKIESNSLDVTINDDTN